MLRDSDVVFFDVNSKKIYHEDTGNVIDESKYNILVQQVSCHDPPDKNSKVGGLAEEIERRTGVRDRSEEGKPWPMGSISIFQKYFADNTQTNVHFKDINDIQRHGKLMTEEKSKKFPMFIVNIRAQELKRPSETNAQRKMRLDAFIKGLEAILKSEIFKEYHPIDIFFPKFIGCGLGGGVWEQYEQVINIFAKMWNEVNGGNVRVIEFIKKNK